MTLALPQADLIGGAVGFFFTVALLSYLIGDNPIYRLALHLFIGVAAGYVGLVVIYQVLTPRLIVPLSTGSLPVILLAIVPLVLFIFLIFKLSPRTAALGNIGVAYLVGVGTAVAVGGAITGTLLPLINTTWKSGGSTLNQGIIVVGAVCTLLYFQFWLRGETTAGGAERAAPMRLLAGIGQGFVVATLGAIYAGMILSGMAVLGERFTTLYAFARQFIR
jgi:hypothetical protein